MINDEEEAKCNDLVAAIAERESIDSDYPDDIPYSALPELSCIRANDPFECMSHVADNNADLAAFDPGMGYTAGEYYNLMPLVAEKYTEGKCGSSNKSYHYSVF